MLLALPLAGCTLIGLGIGAHVDGKAKAKPVPTLSVASAVKGSALELALRDGSLVSGRFDGLDAVPAAQYRERWKQCLQALATTTPVPGLGRVQVRTMAGFEGEATLVGLTPGHVRLLEPAGSGPVNLSFDKLTLLSVPGGGTVEGATLARLAQEGRLPFLEALAVKTDAGRRVVALEDVASAGIRSSHKGKLVGSIVGAAVDAIVVGAFVHSLNTMEF